MSIKHINSYLFEKVTTSKVSYTYQNNKTINNKQNLGHLTNIVQVFLVYNLSCYKLDKVFTQA